MRKLLPILALCTMCIVVLTIASSFSADSGDSFSFSDEDGFTYITDGVVKDGYAEASVVDYTSTVPLDDIVIKEIVKWKDRDIDCIVTNVEEYTFIEEDMKTVKIPKTVTEFDSNACYYCMELEKFIVDPENPVYVAKNGVLEIKNKNILVRCPQNYEKEEFDASDYTVLADFAFSHCKNLKSIILSQYTMVINSSTFNGCTNLEHINYDPVTKKNILPNRITLIGSDAFFGCTNLEQIEFPKELKGIGYNSFCECKKLTKVTIPDEVVDIRYGAFSYCDNIEEFDVSDNNETFQSVDGILFKCSIDSKRTLISYPASRTNDTLILGDDVVSIEKFAFADTKYLETVVLPDIMVDVSDYSFYDAHSIKKVTLGNNTNSIKMGAFSNCINLNEVEIPDCLTNYGDHAFSYCSSLNEIKIPSKLVEIGNYAFFTSGLTGPIILPSSLKNIGESAFAETHLDNIRIEGNPTINSEAFNIKGTITVTHNASLTIPKDAYGSDTIVIDNTVGKWRFPVSNVVGIIICILILIAIILLFKRI